MTTRNKVIIILMIVGIILLMSGITYSIFVVRDITVETTVDSSFNQEINDEERSKIALDAMIRKHTSIISISEAKIKSNIENANPTIKVIDIVRSFPNRIRISVTPRKGLAKIKVEGLADTYILVDEDLYVLRKIDSTQPYVNKAVEIRGIQISKEIYNDGSVIGTTLDKQSSQNKSLANAFAAFVKLPKKNFESLNLSEIQFLRLVDYVDVTDLALMKIGLATNVELFIQTDNKSVENVNISKQIKSAYSLYDAYRRRDEKLKSKLPSSDLLKVYGISNNVEDGIKYGNNYCIKFIEISGNKGWILMKK